MRVLIVDDSPMVWRRLFDMLRELSFVSLLIYARNLTEARRCLAGCMADLLVLDVALPDGNGLELLQQVQESGLQTRVALFTNSTDLRAKGLALGADWFFDKSLDFPELVALMGDRSYWLETTHASEAYADAEAE